MRKFSRWMPPATRADWSRATWFFVLALLAGLIAAAVAWPIFMGLLFGGIVLMQIVGKSTQNRYLRRLAAQRIGEDIGTFARVFDRRSPSFDPWVVRATWDVLEPYVRFPEG